MAFTIGHAVTALLASGCLLLIVAFIALRSTRILHPVLCIHCLKNLGKETTLSYSHSPGEWGICKDCVHEYWNLEGDSGSPS